jgi:hypothetical protein
MTLASALFLTTRPERPGPLRRLGPRLRLVAGFAAVGRARRDAAWRCATHVDSIGSRDAARRLPVARFDRWATAWSLAAPRGEWLAVSRNLVAARGERWGTTVSRRLAAPQCERYGTTSPGGSRLPAASGGSSHEVAGTTAAVETPQAMGDARRRQIHPPDPLMYPRDQTHAATRALKLHKKPRRC